MSTLYLEEQGSKLRKTSKRLIVEKSGQRLLEVPAREIDRVLVFGGVEVSSKALTLLLASGIDVAFLSIRGKLRGRLVSSESKNVFLRIAQYHRADDKSFRLNLARRMVGAKMKNQRTLLLRYQRNHPDVDSCSEIGVISEASNSLNNADDISYLMGLEGASSAAYFRGLSRMVTGGFAFEGRRSHPATDPVNALLSLGYTLITNEIAALVEAAGFDPFVGFLHGIKYGRRSLPLDLVEEFRQPVVDSLVLSVVNKSVIKMTDFHREDTGECYLNKEGFRRFLASYEERLDKFFFYRDDNTRASYRSLFRRQVEHMEKAVLGEEEYKPFVER
jgi:CRISPR-associated protein Cas1